MRRPVRQYSLYLQLLLTLCLLLVVIVLCLSLALGAAYERNAQRLLESSSRQILAQVSHSLERFDASARTYAVALMATNPVVQLMHNSTLGAWDAVRTLDTIRAQLSSDASIHSVYVYNQAQDCFYTTVGNGIQKRASFFDQDAAPLVVRSEERRLVPIPRRVPSAFPTAAGEAVSVYTYILWEQLASGIVPESCVIVNVDAQFVMDTIQAEAHARIVVVDAGGRAVGHFDAGSFLADLSRDELYGRVVRAADPSGSFAAGSGRGRSLVTYVTVPRTGWRLVRSEPYRSVIRPILAQRLLVVLITAAFLASGIGLAALFSRRLSTPVRELARRVRRSLDSSRAAERVGNELEYLSDAFTQTVDRVNLLRRFRDSNLRLLREELLRGLLAGRPLGGELLQAKLKELDLPFDARAEFVCVLARIDHAVDPVPGPIHAIAISETLRAGVGLQWPCEVLETGAGEFVVILQWGPAKPEASALAREGERKRVEGMLFPALAAALERLRASLGLSVSVSVSWPEPDLGGLAALMRQAEELLCYRLLRGPGCIIGPWEARAAQQESPGFPVAEESALLGFLRSADAAGARRAYVELVRIIAQQPYESIMLSLTRLASSVFDFVGTVESNSDLRFPARFSTFTRELGTRETLEEVNGSFGELLDGICATLSSLVTDKSRRNVDRVKEIVEQRYRDSGLCATGIAGELHMSAVYLGKIFREACRCSIAEYVTTFRLERARELLESTDRTVKQIAVDVGIDRARFLFSKFRERYGATPTAYRRRSPRGARS